MLRIFKKVEEVHSLLFKIDNDNARAEFSKSTQTWNAYGKEEGRFVPLGRYSTSKEAITAAKRHKVK